MDGIAKLVRFITVNLLLVNLGVQAPEGFKRARISFLTTSKLMVKILVITIVSISEDHLNQAHKRQICAYFYALQLNLPASPRFGADLSAGQTSLNSVLYFS